MKGKVGNGEGGEWQEGWRRWDAVVWLWEVCGCGSRGGREREREAGRRYSKCEGGKRRGVGKDTMGERRGSGGVVGKRQGWL